MLDVLPSIEGEYYDDADGNVLFLLWKDDVRITDASSYYSYDDGVIALDGDGTLQVLPKEYFNKYFRIQKKTITELYGEAN